MNNYHLLKQCRIDIAINGRVIQCVSYGRHDLKIPNTNLYLVESVSFDALIECAGVKVFDYAMPQTWIKYNYWDNGLPTPRGVWSYDYNGVMGEFVGMEDMLRMVGDKLSQMGITSIYAYA